MIFYIPALAFLIYNLYKKRTKTAAVLIVLCLISGAAYMGARDLFVEPIRFLFPAVAIVAALYLIYLSRREYVDARSAYLKERRMARENENNHENTDDDHERIVITNSKSDEEKVIYLKREDKDVPHGTMKDETKTEEEKIERKCSTWNTPLFLFARSFDTIVKKGVAL